MENNLTFDAANDAFFADFIKCISTEPDDVEVVDTSCCLITNEPLKKYAIRLNCGHTFNYEPLYNAIHEYKQDMMMNNGPVADTHCPYCRERTEGLLPYVPTSEKAYGVNMPHNHSFGKNLCKHVMRNKKECGRKCYFDKCHLHLEINDNLVTMCKGITKAGNPCKYKASTTENYCKLHSK
jgi:hypothetical protein